MSIKRLNKIAVNLPDKQNQVVNTALKRLGFQY